MGLARIWGAAGGAAAGALCALLALLAIFSGKYYSVSFYLKAEVETVTDNLLIEEVYLESKEQSRTLKQLAAEQEYPAFMVAHGFTEAEKVEEITAEELESFIMNVVPEMKSFDSKYPTYSVWKALKKRDLDREVRTSSFLRGAVIDNLGLIDLLFAFLGIATAFKVGAGVEEAEA